MKKLIGTPKQIKWANEIRERILIYLREELEQEQKEYEKYTNETNKKVKQKYIREIEKAIDGAENYTNSERLIANRMSIDPQEINAYADGWERIILPFSKL